MPELPMRKAGIIACSCEELAEGTVARLAALKVLQEVRPQDTVTICLPLFLAGGEGDRAFARFHPTIAVDGCELRCAARATEMHSGKPAASIVVNDLASEHGLEPIEGRRRLNESGCRAVELTAERLAALVDKALGKDGPSQASSEPAGAPAGQAETVATCSCGSGIPVTMLGVDGRTEEVVALPLIMQRFHEAGRAPDNGLADELLKMVKIYNPVPEEAEGNWREALLREYQAYCAKERQS